MFVAAFAAVPLRGEEPPASRVRDLLHTLIMESLPDLPAVPPVEYAAPAIKKGKIEDDVVMLEPIVVSESNGVRALARMIAREKRQEEEEKFSVIEGGTIVRKGRLRIGTWAGKDGDLDLVRIEF